MLTRLVRSAAALLFAVTGWLLCPGSAQAHPQLAGEWMSPTPPGGFLVFHFGQGEHLGNGLWRGVCSLNVSNCSVVSGTYELNMINDHEATLTPLRNATNTSPTVGIVDLGSGVLTLKNVTYRRRGPVLTTPAADPKATK